VSEEVRSKNQGRGLRQPRRFLIGALVVAAVSINMLIVIFFL